MKEDTQRADELLEAILRAGGPEVAPVIDLRKPQGFYYPFLEDEGFNPSSTGALEALVARGELERAVRYKLLLCPKDGNAHLRSTTVCPSCSSEDVHREVLIEHFRCGHIAPEADFKAAEGLECPKCGRRLKLLGKDFRRPADFYRCQECQEVTYIPDFKLHCPQCRDYYPPDEVKSLAVYSYRVREEDRPTVVYSVLMYAFEVLGNAGYNTRVFHDLEGLSGVTHRVDLYAYKEVSGIKTEVLLEVFISSTAVSSKPLINFFAKAEDLGISNLLFLAIPVMEESARGYAHYHGIKVLESELAEVHEKLPDFLREELFLTSTARSR